MWALRGQRVRYGEHSSQAADSTTWAPAYWDLCLSALRFGWCSRRLGLADVLPRRHASTFRPTLRARRSELERPLSSLLPAIASVRLLRTPQLREQIVGRLDVAERH